MTPASLRPDCTRCAALCCIAFPFEPSAAFAIDKPAGAPCPNLDGCGGCTIYGERNQRGFGGCISFDCQGAGQRVVQDIFAGRSWQDDPELLQPMLRAFAVMRGVHRLLSLLATLRKAPFASRHVQTISRFEAALNGVAGSAAQASASAALADVEDEVETFLTSLRAEAAAS